MSNSEGEDPSTSLTETDAEPAPIPTEVARPSRWQKRWSTLHWRAHCLAPNFIPHPAGLTEKDYARDTRANEKSRIDTSAELRAPIIWGAELYGPAEIGNLYAGLKTLGWTRAGGWKPEHAAAEQLRSMRGHGEGAWLNIGHINRHDSNTSFRIDKNSATLPDGVESLIVTASQVTASLTVIIIGFHLDEPHAARYESELNLDRRTRRQRVRKSWTVEWLDPTNQKIDAVNSARSERRAMVASWFSHNMPGYFCGRNLASRFPTMELLVARGLSLMNADDPNGRNKPEWHRLLLSTSPYDAWGSPSRPGLQLGLEWHLDKNPGLHVCITLDPDTFPDDAIASHRGTGPRAYSWYSDEIFSDFLVHCATIEYLKTHASDLHITRERLKLARSKHRNVVKTLNEIGRFFDGNLGSPAVAKELAAYSEHEVWFARSCGDFGSDPWHGGDRRKLHAEMQEGVRYRATRLAEDEAALRTHFEQLATILSVRESIRLQRWTLFLTLFAVAIAIGSLWITTNGPERAQGDKAPAPTAASEAAP